MTITSGPVVQICAHAEMPLDWAAERRIDTLVKSVLHDWLVDHAANYGFEYSFKLGEEPGCS